MNRKGSLRHELQSKVSAGKMTQWSADAILHKAKEDEFARYEQMERVSIGYRVRRNVTGRFQYAMEFDGGQTDWVTEVYLATIFGARSFAERARCAMSHSAGSEIVHVCLRRKAK